MSEQKEISSNNLISEVANAANTEELMQVAQKVLYTHLQYIEDADKAKSEGKPWVGFDLNVNTRIYVRQDDLQNKKVLRIDRWDDKMVVKSGQMVSESGIQNGFEGISYIEGREKTQMVSSKGSYLSEYGKPLEGDEAIPKIKELIKSLI